MPTCDAENWYREAGEAAVAGFDEVGMAAFAGPVVVAGVVLETVPEPWYDRLDDSKKLSREVREELACIIAREARAYVLTLAWPEEIDQVGVFKARNRAMVTAYELLLEQLKIEVWPEPVRLAAIVDGKCLHGLLPPPSMYMNHADELSNSVAAASILAKVTRDGIMRMLATQNPGYESWDHNVGYGTKEHQAAIERVGPTVLHRFSFRPLSKYSRLGIVRSDGTGG
jgi:ribonuclease HII